MARFALVVVALLVLAAPAQAGVVRKDPGDVVVYEGSATGTPGEEVGVYVENSFATVNAKRGFTEITAPCEPDPDPEQPTIARCPLPVALFRVITGAGDDSIDAGTSTVPLEANGGGGEDNLYGSAQNDVLTGGEAHDSIDGKNGDDRLDGGLGGDSLSGGLGNDTLYGGEDDDGLYGEDGDDQIFGGGGADYIADGAGNDVVDAGAAGDTIGAGGGSDTYIGGEGDNDEVSYSDRSAPVTVTLDDVADDGEAGEGDNVKPDVEKADGGSGNDRLVGNALDNGLYGNEGNDSLDGGPGADGLYGGGGDDTINAVDGNTSDYINCGSGNDTLVADQNDSFENCENVTIPDADGDGFPAPPDCDNNDATRYPGAPEILYDGIDQDCDGPADDGGRPRVLAQAVSKVAFYGRNAKLLKLNVPGLFPGDVVELRCKGKSCPKKARKRTVTVKPGASTVNFIKYFKGRRLKPGTTIEIRIRRADILGRYFQLKIRSGKKTKSTQKCLEPNATAPTDCPPG